MPDPGLPHRFKMQRDRFISNDYPLFTGRIATDENGEEAVLIYQRYPDCWGHWVYLPWDGPIMGGPEARQLLNALLSVMTPEWSDWPVRIKVDDEA